MSMLQLILEQPGKRRHIPFLVRGDLPIGRIVPILVERLHFPKWDSNGVPLAYQLCLVTNGRPLPFNHSCFSLHLPSGTRVRVEAETASSPTIPVSFRRSPLVGQQMHQEHISRRRVLTTGGILVACSLAGLGTGATTALAQRIWDRRLAEATPPLQVAPSSAPSPQPTFTVEPMFRFTAHQAIVQALAFSPDGSMLASGDDDTQLLLWQPDGTIRQEVLHSDAISALAWSPSGQRLVTGSGNAVTFLQVQNGQRLATSQNQHRAPVTGLVWSEHPRHPVISTSLDKRALVWETVRYRKIGAFTKHTAPIEAVSCPQRGAIVASCSQGGLIRVWSQDTLRELHGFYQVSSVALRTIAFDLNGAHLAVGGDDGIIRIWENVRFCQRSVTVGTSQRCTDAPQRLAAHRAAVRALAFSPDESLLATAGDNAQLCFWGVKASFTPLTSITLHAPILAISWSPDGRFLAAAAGPVVHVFRLS